MSEKIEVCGMDQETMTKVVNKLENKGGKKIGLEFLPFYDVATEKLQWDIMRAANPMANFRAVDGESELVGRRAFDRGYAEIVSMSIKERFNTSDLRAIREAGMLPVVDNNPSMIAQMGAEAKKKLRQALERCKTAVDNRVEWMAINALLGKIEFSGKVKFSVDYGITPGQTGIIPSVLWSTTASADPLGDIQTWQDLVQENTGIVPNTIIMSRAVLRLISKNTTVRDAMKYTNPVLNLAAAKKFIEDNTEVTNVIVYDSMYTDNDGGNSTRFLDESYIIMLPGKDQLPDGVGDIARAGHPLANYQPGYYTFQKEEIDPYGVFVGVGLDAFPRITHPEVLLNAKVK